MADYNVQMKQYNGTSFDNILPYASKIAGGGGDSEIITTDGVALSRVASGQYVGTGTSRKVDLVIPFKPKVVFLYSNYYGSDSTSTWKYLYEVGADGTVTRTSASGYNFDDKINYHTENYSFESYADSYYLTGIYVDSAMGIINVSSYSPPGFSRVTMDVYTLAKMEYEKQSNTCSLSVIDHQLTSSTTNVSGKVLAQSTYAMAYNESGIKYYWIALG